MSTLDKWTLKSILHQLSLIEKNHDHMRDPNGPVAANNVNMIQDIRSKLLNVALQDIAVESVGEP